MKNKALLLASMAAYMPAQSGLLQAADFRNTNAIFFPKKHTKMTWNQQRQKAKKRNRRTIK